MLNKDSDLVQNHRLQEGEEQQLNNRTHKCTHTKCVNDQVSDSMYVMDRSMKCTAHAGKFSHRGDGNTNLEFLTPGPGILDQTHTGNNYDVVTGEGKHNMAINMWKQEHTYHM